MSVGKGFKIKYMKNKKYTVNERLALLEKMTYKLALEIQAIVTAIKKSSENK